MAVFKEKKVVRPWEGSYSSSPERKGCFSTGEHVKLYHSTVWRKLTAAHLREFPLCQCAECAKLPVPKPATITDHILPVKDGGDFFAWNNLQSLNSVCHNKKSAKEKRR